MAGGGRVDGGEGGRIQLEVGRAGVLARLRGRARAAQGGADPAVAGGPGDHQLCVRAIQALLQGRQCLEEGFEPLAVGGGKARVAGALIVARELPPSEATPWSRHGGSSVDSMSRSIRL
ncbi:hypothetical protein G6F57_023218 [Rhizopus arrhizus]|nr:hypothetical protein G6F57_023218 [Rhizopus arrhizus]